MAKRPADAGAASPRRGAADLDGFTDSLGRRMTFDAGIRNAARCIRDQGDVGVIEDLIRWNLAPDEILEWLVYPESGEFADTFGVGAAQPLTALRVMDEEHGSGWSETGELTEESRAADVLASLALVRLRLTATAASDASEEETNG